MDSVKVETIRPGVALVTMNRPENRNALSPHLIGDLKSALRGSGDNRAIRVVILTGAGKAFCAGADMKGGSLPARAEGYGRLGTAYKYQEDLVDLMLLIRELQKPVIAAVNGAAVGGGLAIALHSDIRIASESARFGAVFIRVGLSSCDVGTSYLLPRLVGAGRAAELMLTGRIFGAEEAERIGLVLRVVPDGKLMDCALETAELIRENSEYGVWMTKQGLWANLDAPSLRHAIELYETS
jgi:enoyl-CoA hydratase